MENPKGDRPDSEYLSARIIQEFVDLANEFTTDLSIVLIPGLQSIFIALVGIWAILSGVKVMFGTVNVRDFFKDFMYVCISYLLLFSQGKTLVYTLFNTAFSVIGSAASMVINSGAKLEDTPEASGFASLAISVEEGMSQVVHMAMSIAAEWSVTNPLTILYAVALILPFILLLLGYMSQIVIAIVRLILLASFSAYLMLAYGYEWGREMAKEGIKTLLSTFIVLLGSTVAVSLVIYGVTRLEIGKTGSLDVETVSLADPAYLFALLIGWLGTALMVEGTAQANSISKSALTNNAAGIMTAGVAGTGYALAKKAATGVLPSEMEKALKKHGDSGLGANHNQSALERYQSNIKVD